MLRSVGAKLLYPDETIQHAGVILGVGGVAGHARKHLPDRGDGYFGRTHLTHSVSAVTGACLVVRKELYQAVGGMDADRLPVAFNDVDLCLKIQALGKRNLMVPDAILYHRESASRGSDQDPSNRAVQGRDRNHERTMGPEAHRRPVLQSTAHAGSRGFRVLKPTSPGFAAAPARDRNTWHAKYIFRGAPPPAWRQFPFSGKLIFPGLHSLDLRRLVLQYV
jgi:GT2 family glycosyltransferase